MIGDKLTSEEAAEYLGISTRTLDLYCLEKRIPYRKVGRRRAFDKRALNDYINSQKIETKEEAQ